MRYFVFVLILVFSSIAFSQGKPAGVPAGMQEAMECMTSLDQDALKEFGKEGEKVGEQIKALCKEGDESGAKDVAMAFVEQLASNEEVKKLKKCSEIMRKTMPSMPIPEIPSAEMYENEADSICESIE